MTNIHNKYDENWIKEVKKQSLILEKSETDDTKKKSKQLEKLLSERETLDKEKQEKDTEIKKITAERKSLLNIASYVREVEREETRLTTNAATHTSRMNNFLGTGTGTKWRTDGWNKKTTDHFTPAGGKLDNLYKVKVNNAELETTEEQIINTIAYVVQALKKIDKDDFTSKYNAKQSDTAKKTKVATYLRNIQQQEIIVGSDKDSAGNDKQPTYDFATTYSKFDKATNTWTAYTAPAFNYSEFFEFLELVHNQSFLPDLDNDKQKNVPNSSSWQILEKGSAWKKEELADYGINIDPAKTTLYKTGSEKQTIAVGVGISGWLDLAHSFTYCEDNKTKLVEAFTNSPTQQLLEDLKSWYLNSGATTDGTNFTLPESLPSLQELKDQLEMEKLGAAVKLVELKKSIADQTQERDAKQGAIKAKETQIATLIREIITAKRAQLTSYNIAKGFAKTTSEDNRRSLTDLCQLKNLLEEIRYLENDGNATLPSSQSEENTALTQVAQILAAAGYHGGSTTYLVAVFSNLAYQGGDPEKYDIPQAITRIKAGKYTDKDGKEENIAHYGDLAQFKEHFANKANLVKLTAWEEQAQTAIDKALNGEDNVEEKLTDWQTKLKALDSALDESIITEAWKTKWSTIGKHQKIADVEKLIKKVISTDGKIKQEFIDEIKKSDATLLDLKTLLGKEPKDIITYIARFEYNQLDDTATDEKEKKANSKKRRIAKKLNKSKDSELTDQELNDSLYKLEIGELTLDNKFYTADLQELTETQDPGQNEEKTGFSTHMGKHWWKYGLGVIGTGGLLVTIFWKQVKGWWQGPAEEMEESRADTSEEKDEENE